MSVRLVTAIGLISLAMTVAISYVAFAQIYAPSAAQAEAEQRGEPAPISVVSFVWPTGVHEFWWKFFVGAGMFAVLTAVCLLHLARRASAKPT